MYMVFNTVILFAAIIPKTVSEERMQVNLQLDFTIPKEEMDVINNIPIRKKYAWDPETVF